MKTQTLKKMSLSLISFLLNLFIFSIAEAIWLSPAKLTDNYAADQVPALSGDGKRIVYYSDADGDNDIYLLTWNGKNWSRPLKLTENDYADFLPDINLDGTCITYHGGKGDERHIYFIEEKDGVFGEPVQITDGITRDYYPSIDNSGEKITYMARLDEGGRTFRDIYIVTRKDGLWQNPKKLTEATCENVFPVISGNGEVIAFHGRSDENVDRDIYAIYFQNNKWLPPFLLTENETTDMQTSINDDGTRIVYYWMENYLPHVTPGANADIHLLECRDGLWQKPQPLTNTPLYEYDPTLSGDGKRVTFVQADGNTGIERICILEENNGTWNNLEILTSSFIAGYRPQISSDGKKIVFYGVNTMDPDFEIYLLEDTPQPGIIQGTVKKVDTGEGVPGVILETQPGRYLTASDESGNFQLKVLPGSYTINTLMDCYQPTSQVKIKEVKAGEIVDQNIFLTLGNCFPYEPSTPAPANNVQDQPLNLTLSWKGGDPDESDKVFYDVYLGTGTEHHLEMKLVSHHQRETSYSPQGLWYDTTYYWKIVAQDKAGAEIPGPRWCFTTMKASISGVIREAITGEPLKNCKVHLFSSENDISKKTSSDLQGRYGFDSLPPGRYYLVLRKKGYKAEYQEVVYNGESVSLNFSLQPIK